MFDLEPIPEEPSEDVEIDEEEPRTSALQVSVPSSSDLSSSSSKLLEFPHACVAFSDAATWGSPLSVDTPTDVPSTSDELSVCADSEEYAVEFADDLAVHGGPEISIGDPFPRTIGDMLPIEAERENCDADVEEVPLAAPRPRRIRRKRWYQNLLNQNHHLRAIVASISLPPGEQHAEMVDKDAMQQVVRDEGKIIVPPAKVKSSVGPERERWKLAAEGELTKNFVNTSAYHKSTPDEIKRHGRPPPMKH